MKKILLLNGPNLNMLGIREPDKYGTSNLKEIIEDLKSYSLNKGLTLIDFQTNSENEMIDRIHQAKLFDEIRLIIINPAAWTHTSIAIRDAISSTNIPFIEVHISNIYSREKFRHLSYFSDIAIGTITGFGSYGYKIAIQAAINFLKE